MKTQHTPGPWRYGKASREVWADGGQQVASCTILNFPTDGQVQEQIANARLIAAAPVLLEACYTALNAHTQGAGGITISELCDVLRAAIADAVGN